MSAIIQPREDALYDAQDALEETLRPYRKEYAHSLWEDTQTVVEAVTESLNARPKSCLELRDGIAVDIVAYVDDYFDDMARQQIKTMDDI